MCELNKPCGITTMVGDTAGLVWWQPSQRRGEKMCEYQKPCDKPNKKRDCIVAYLGPEQTAWYMERKNELLAIIEERKVVPFRKRK